jgi:hypothetical protein
MKKTPIRKLIYCIVIYIEKGEVSVTLARQKYALFHREISEFAAEISHQVQETP